MCAITHLCECAVVAAKHQLTGLREGRGAVVLSFSLSPGRWRGRADQTLRRDKKREGKRTEVKKRIYVHACTRCKAPASHAGLNVHSHMHIEPQWARRCAAHIEGERSQSDFRMILKCPGKREEEEEEGVCKEAHEVPVGEVQRWWGRRRW